MVYCRSLWLLSLAFMIRVESFQHSRICKRIRVGYKMFERKNREELTVAKSTMSENIESIVKDDIANDVLYFLKFYHLTNDDYQSYIYIVFYEVLNVFLSKQKRANLERQVPISLASIVMYVFVKTIILQNLFHHK